MQISILSVQSVTAQGAKGPYQTLEVAYKNLTFQGKVESKKVMPFGAQKAVFDALANATVGNVFDITVVKNDKGYNDWTSAKQAAPGSIATQAQGSINGAGNAKATGGNTVQVKSTYETPEERAKKQIYIIRQSSISAAVASLTPGAKIALKPEDVVNTAQHYYNWVMQDPTAAVASDVFEMPDDLNTEVM